MRRVSEETRIADECCKSGGPRATARTMNFDIRETGEEGSTRERATAALFFFGSVSFGKFTTGLYHAGHSRTQ